MSHRHIKTPQKTHTHTLTHSHTHTHTNDLAKFTLAHTHGLANFTRAHTAWPKCRTIQSREADLVEGAVLVVLGEAVLLQEVVLQEASSLQSDLVTLCQGVLHQGGGGGQTSISTTK